MPDCEVSPHAVTVVAVTVPGQVVVIITGGVAVELARPGAGLETPALSLVSVVTVVVVREIPSVGHSSAQSLALLASHDGAELGQQPVAPVTQRVHVEIIAVPGLGGCCCRLSCGPLGCCGRRGGRSGRGPHCGSWCGGFLGGGIRAYNMVGST